MRTLYFFIGTQAELMKLFKVIIKARDEGFECKIISTGQNDLLSFPFLKLSNSTVDIDITSNKANKKNTSGYLQWFINTCLNGRKIFNKFFTDEKRKDALAVVHGDTLTTVMGAWICKSIKLPYVHIESGPRSFNIFSPFPEEIDRLYGSTHSVMNFCPGKIHADYAQKKFKGEAIDTIYNTGIETLYYALNAIKRQKHIIQPKEKYFMFMLHRQENIMKKSFVIKIVKEIEKMANKMKCIFIYHEQTKMKMEQFGVFNKIKNHKNITVISRQSYLDFIKLVSYAEFIVTDGCGNQQEFYYLGKPYLILRTAVEKNTEGINWNAKIFNNDFDSMIEFMDDYVNYIKPAVVPKILPSTIIIDNIKRWYDGKNT